MASVNSCTFIGNAGRDAEMHYTQGGTATANFSLAVSYKSRDKEETEWVNVVLFGETAERLSQYITKGKSLYVNGRLQTRSWQGDDGQKHYRTEVIANSIQLLGGAPTAGTAPRQTAQEDFDDSELPFE